MAVKIPKLASSKRVAEILGIDRKNMIHRRKNPNFPQPIQIVDGFPVWVEADIYAWLESKNKRSSECE